MRPAPFPRFVPFHLVLIALWLLPVGLARAAGPAGEEEGRTPEIVRRALEHHGSDVLERSRVSLTVASKSGSFDLVAEPGPVFDYTVISGRGPGRVVSRHTNEPGAPELTETRDGETVELSGSRGQRLLDFVSARVYFLFLPYRLEDPDTYLDDLGLERWNGRPLHKVRLRFEEGSSTNADESFLFWFDPETAELEQFAYSFSGGIRFRRLVDERRIGGILFADQENYAASGDLSVDVITPEFADDMELLSVVRLTDIEVEPRD